MDVIEVPDTLPSFFVGPPTDALASLAMFITNMEAVELIEADEPMLLAAFFDPNDIEIHDVAVPGPASQTYFRYW